MISCGEPSGDLYAGLLATEILRADPSASITAFGGDHLRDAGASLIGHFTGISVTGLLEVVRVLPRTYAMYRRLVEVTLPNTVRTCSSLSTFRTSISGSLVRCGGWASRSSTTSARSSGPGVPPV